MNFILSKFACQKFYKVVVCKKTQAGASLKRKEQHWASQNYLEQTGTPKVNKTRLSPLWMTSDTDTYSVILNIIFQIRQSFDKNQGNGIQLIKTVLKQKFKTMILQFSSCNDLLRYPWAHWLFSFVYFILPTL